jgi:hypothetical protein
MSTPVQFPISQAGFAHLHAGFLGIAPRIVTHGHIYFRHIRCPLQREDAISEMLALVWLFYVRLSQRGKDPAQFVSALATFAARRVQSGGRLTGMEKSRDVLSPLAQHEHGFVVKMLPDTSTLGTNPLAEALLDNTQTPIPEQVAFRQDFPAWRLTRTERDRRIMDALMFGERPLDISRRHGISPGRVSQLRRDFHDDWCRFCADPAETVVAGT